MNDHGVKGGQGRSQADIRKDATSMLWTWFLLGGLLLALLGASQ